MQMETPNNRIEIKLTELQRGDKSTTFTGRPQGMTLRISINLDKLDKDNNNYVIVIPSRTTSFNPSFYLGLFFKSIKTLGGLNKFKVKYEIKFEEENSELRDLLMERSLDCEREADNEFLGVTGLDSII